MRRVNLREAEPRPDDRREQPEGFRMSMARLGGEVGAERTGATLYELPPGQAVCPYHYEYGEEEWALVVEGRPSARTPEGTEQLEPLDLVFFPRGPDGAHQIRNDSAETARVLIWSDVVIPTATVYPDSDKIGIWTGNRDDDMLAPRSAGVEYFEGEG